jgi:hypothetical protein
MYKQVKPMFEGESETCVKRICDNAFIPFAEGNTDYAEYLKWLDEGNKPLPPDEPNV